jgi:putative tRNA adenosine deaminase-associated protein
VEVEMAVDDIDYVVAAWREEGRWSAAPLPPHAADSLDNLLHALRQFPGEGGVLGFVSLAEDITIIVRSIGMDVRVCMSDATAAEDFDLAVEIVDLVGGPLADEIDEDDPAVAGDVTLLADLGLDARELQMLCEDDELFPDDIFAAIAGRLGFADEFEQARDESGT